MNENEITPDMVRARLLYVRAIGRLVWTRSPRENFQNDNKWSVWNSRYAGQVAGSIGTLGYRAINVFGKMRKASRLTWVYHNGYWPNVIDHIDGDQENDAIENLRDVDQAGNCKNRALGANNTTGVYGVYRDGNAIRAQITVNGRRVYLGTFDTIEDAAEARREAEFRYGFHPNHGRLDVAPELAESE